MNMACIYNFCNIPSKLELDWYKVRYTRKNRPSYTGFSSLQHVSSVSHYCPATSWGKMWTRWWSNLSFKMFISKLQNLPKAGLNIKMCICTQGTCHVYIYIHIALNICVCKYIYYIWFIYVYMLYTYDTYDIYWKPNHQATIPMEGSPSFSPAPGNSHKMCSLVLAGIACSMVVGKVFPKPTEELLDRRIPLNPACLIKIIVMVYYIPSIAG